VSFAPRQAPGTTPASMLGFAQGARCPHQGSPAIRIRRRYSCATTRMSATGTRWRVNPRHRTWPPPEGSRREWCSTIPMAFGGRDRRCTWRVFSNGDSTPDAHPPARRIGVPRVLRELGWCGGSSSLSTATGGPANVFFRRPRRDRQPCARIIATVRTSGYLIVQEYVAAAGTRDKRVLLLAGVPSRGWWVRGRVPPPPCKR